MVAVGGHAAVACVGDVAEHQRPIRASGQETAAAWAAWQGRGATKGQLARHSMLQHGHYQPRGASSSQLAKAWALPTKGQLARHSMLQHGHYQPRGR